MNFANDDQNSGADYNSALTHRVLRGLAGPQGRGVFDRKTLTGEIVALLRDDQPLSREVRDALADAIARGLKPARKDDQDQKDDKPRLTLSNTNAWGDWGKMVLTRRRWWDAGEAALEARERGELDTDTRIAIGKDHGIDLKQLENAIFFHKEFLSEYNNLESPLRINMRARGLDFDLSIGLEEDHYYAARATYIERRASEATGYYPPDVDA